jgi:SAM-dependent MidA family methyltransferase
MPLSLPIPTEHAQQHSLRLLHLIKQKIAAQGKISFHDFMQMALYEPGLGYYSAGSCKLGAAGDFITAPEISPLFGMSLVNNLSPLIAQLKNPNWLELGAGTGKLASSILLYLAKEKQLPEYYFILEVSADLKQRQQEMLMQELSPELFAKIIWLDRLPEKFNGIILANEVLDALAVHRFQITAEHIKEYYICLNEHDQLQECLDAPSSEYLMRRIAALGISTHNSAPPCSTADSAYISEINLQQEALLKTLSITLEQGFILFIDYGFPAKEFYHPQREQGTLMCHYQHRAHSDILFWPGLQDITAHIDFTALAKSGLEHSLSLINFSTQTAWLLQGRILELAEMMNKTASPQQQLLNQQALHQLISTEEMGELFKVILFGKNIDAIKINHGAMDMRYRL